LEDRVEFTGFIDPVDSAFDRASIVCVPSTIESFGNVAVEAMLRGKPVVAASIGGLREIIEDGVTGLLCIPGDSMSLASSIARLLADPGLAESIAREAERNARARFSIERYASDIVDVVCRIINRRPSQS
jgi:glycosyltransferase involved in cell wall biosynthesis